MSAVPTCDAAAEANRAIETLTNLALDWRRQTILLENEGDKLRAMLDRIARIADDYFHPPAEECVADGVEHMADKIEELEKELEVCRSGGLTTENAVQSDATALGSDTTLEGIPVTRDSINSLAEQAQIWVRHAKTFRDERDALRAENLAMAQQLATLRAFVAEVEVETRCACSAEYTKRGLHEPNMACRLTERARELLR